MARIHPHNPTPLEQLTPHINQAIGNIAEGYGQYRTKQKDEEILKQIPNATSPEHLIPLIAKLSPEKQKTFSTLYAPYLASNAKSQAKENERAAGEKRTQEDVKHTLDTLQSLKPYAGSTKIPFTKSWNASEFGVNREGLRKRAQIDTQSLKLEKILINENTKGTLRGKTFDILMEKVPKSSDSETVYQGKLDAFYDELKLAPKEVQKKVKEVTGIEAKDENSTGTTLIITPSGRTVPIPNNEVEAALKAGGKRA